MLYLARLKPLNPKRGHNTKSYTYQGRIYKEELGWHEVDSEETAEYLSRATADGNPESLPIFDVCTEAQAQRMDQREREAVQVRAPAERPMKVQRIAAPTTGRGDLRSGEVRRESVEEREERLRAEEEAREAEEPPPPVAASDSVAARLNRERRERAALASSSKEEEEAPTEAVVTPTPSPAQVIPGAPRKVRRPPTGLGASWI